MAIAAPPSPAADEIDADLRELAEARETLITLPADCQAPPFQVGQRVQLTVGTPGDAVLTTEAEVDSIGEAADRQIVLRLFAPLGRHQRRSDVRLALDLPARRTLRVLTGSQALPIRSRVLDLSAGGLLLQTDVQLAAGDRLALAFTLPGEAQELRVSVVVRHTQEAEKPRQWRVGCQFQVVRPADREHIARYIFSQQREAARRRSTLAA